MRKGVPERIRRTASRNMSILRHQQIRTGVAQVHCKEGSARNPIVAIIRHTGSMPELGAAECAPLFRPTLAKFCVPSHHETAWPAK
jgi:hypothetical protein